ncbi:MAG: hypothetical protein GY870_14945 [archaeon]|nr:hypothetical protein [archaeon]
MNDKEEILKLKDGEEYTIPESDYGKGEIWLKNDTYFLFSIPMYGGEPSFQKAYSLREIDEMIKEYESWT